MSKEKPKNRREVKCLFGYHEYTIPYTCRDHAPTILLCDHCMRFGYCKYSNGTEMWYEYNEKGNVIHRKHSNGSEAWYDENGDMIYYKYSNGYEVRARRDDEI